LGLVAAAGYAAAGFCTASQRDQGLQVVSPVKPLVDAPP